MTTKTEFTQEEWEALQKGVTGAGFLMAVSDRSFFDSFKEAGALARHLSEARKSASSELIRELAEARGTGFGLTSSPDEIESETLGALRNAMQVLETKAPEEVDAYRSFVLEVAESVKRPRANRSRRSGRRWAPSLLPTQADCVQVVLDDLVGPHGQIVPVVVLGVEVAAGKPVEAPGRERAHEPRRKFGGRPGRVVAEVFRHPRPHEARADREDRDAVSL